VFQAEASGRLSASDISLLFGNIDQVLEMSQELLQVLENASSGLKAIREHIKELRKSKVFEKEIAFESDTFKATKRNTYRQPGSFEGVDLTTFINDIKPEEFWIGSAFLLKVCVYQY
jgi:hypothetical protein